MRAYKGRNKTCKQGNGINIEGKYVLSNMN